MAVLRLGGNSVPFHRYNTSLQVPGGSEESQPRSPLQHTPGNLHSDFLDSLLPDSGVSDS
jgi:hypothetical protein